MRFYRPLSLVLALAAVLTASGGPVGTSFTYSGRLLDRANANQPANGVYDFQFGLYPQSKGGKATASALLASIPVTNGLFSVIIDFGGTPFDPTYEQWLETGYRPQGSQGDFIFLSPRQKLTATPLASVALCAAKAQSIQLTGDFRVPGAGVGTPTPAFVHQATTGNISSHLTYIDNPACNGNPDALLSVTHNWSKDSASGADGAYEKHPFGVYYDGSSGQWTIFHEDLASMPPGRAYNVLVIKP